MCDWLGDPRESAKARKTIKKEISLVRYSGFDSNVFQKKRFFFRFLFRSIKRRHKGRKRNLKISLK